MSRRKKYGESKPILVVTPNKKVVGLKHKEFSLAIGMWVRQRENIPLTVELFKDVDSEYVDRVVQLARVMKHQVIDRVLFIYFKCLLYIITTFFFFL